MTCSSSPVALVTDGNRAVGRRALLHRTRDGVVVLNHGSHAQAANAVVAASTELEPRGSTVHTIAP